MDIATKPGKYRGWWLLRFAIALLVHAAVQDRGSEEQAKPAGSQEPWKEYERITKVGHIVKDGPGHIVKDGPSL